MMALTTSFGLALCCSAATYALLTLLAVVLARRRNRRQPPVASGVVTPVSVLKPLRGIEPCLYENLRSFCDQNHPAFEVLFGVRDPKDPAIATVRRLQAEFPAIDIALVVDPRLHGRNYKASNLANLFDHARHPLVVVADSDIGVGRDYLQRVCAPLEAADSSAAVGIVTCLYHGRALAGFWPRLGAMFVDEWFAPSVRLAHLFGSRHFAFGATIALRKQTLQQVGGFQAVANHLADDYRLGELTREAGLRTVLSDYIVSTDVTEGSALPLLQHELRWLRTIRSLNFPGYLFAVASFSLPCAVVGALLAQGSAASFALLVLVGGCRAGLHFAVAERHSYGFRQSLYTLALVPLRDTLNVVMWAIGLLGRRVDWAGQRLQFDANGLFRDSAR